MSKRLTSGIVAAIVAVSMSIPAVGLADHGGHPHSKQACKVHRHYGKHRGDAKGHKRGFDRGKKCGFPPTGQTGQTGATGQTGQTGETGQTGMTGDHPNHGHHRGQDKH